VRCVQLILCSALLSLTAFATGEKIEFPFQQGWEGADAAYSIPLGGGRYLWLFGDTFVGPPTDAERKHVYGMPRNSIGIARCPKSAPCSVHYYWSKMGTNIPHAFFDTGTDEWYWPLDGFMWQNKLYVVLSLLHAKGEGAFGFESSGVVLATITNIASSPERWKISYQTILQSSEVAPGSSVVIAGDRAYFFTFANQNGARYMALTRLPLKNLNHNHAALAEGHWEYLAENGAWTAWKTQGELPNDAKHVMQDGYTEFTVRYHPAEKRWLAVMPSSLLESRGLYSVADAIEGPWSKPQTLYKYPETQPGNAQYTPHVFCYADKEHPELESQGELVFTYACNSTVLEEISKNPKLYHPVLVTTPMPPNN